MGVGNTGRGLVGRGGGFLRQTGWNFTPAVIEPSFGEEGKGEGGEGHWGAGKG